MTSSASTVGQGMRRRGRGRGAVGHRGQAVRLPIATLLGGYRKTLPCYASSTHGDENGGLTRPEDFAEFALQCKEEFGYPAFKIHGWVNGPVERDAAAVLAIRKAVGDEMDLMLDPAGAMGTFDDVLRVGRACDEGRFMWLEDPSEAVGSPSSPTAS